MGTEFQNDLIQFQLSRDREIHVIDLIDSGREFQSLIDGEKKD